MISASTNFEGKTVKLGADIKVNDGKAVTWAKSAPKNTWCPIKTFAGTFDGQGNTISGLYFHSNQNALGFFSRTTLKSTVKNLRVTNSYFESTSETDGHVGGIAGRGGGVLIHYIAMLLLSARAGNAEELLDKLMGMEKT